MLSVKNSKYKIYFIDYENINRFEPLKKEVEKIKVVVFVGKLQNTMSIETVTKLVQLTTNIEFVKMSGEGKNCLDFQLCYKMGEMHKTIPALVEFVILSKDKGFDNIVKHVKSLGRQCARKEILNKKTTIMRFDRNVIHDSDDTFIEDYLFTLFCDYFKLLNSDDIPYDTTRYSVKKENPDISYETAKEDIVYNVYLLEIKIFQIILVWDEGFVKIGEIYHRNHYIDLIERNYTIVSQFVKEKMKNDILQHSLNKK